MNTQRWFDRPYPLVNRLQDKALLVLAFALFTYVFLLLYQPFGAAEIQYSRSVFLLGFAGSVLVALGFNYFLLPQLFRSIFQPEHWQIKKEICYIAWSFFLVAVLNYWYNSTVGKDIAPQHSLLQFLGITFSVGIFPLLGQIFLTERYLSRRNQEQAEALVQQKLGKLSPKPTLPLLRIQAETLRSGPLEISLDNFLFATSDSNYTTIFYLQEGQVQRQLLRLSLKNIAEQVQDFEAIVRCHRSYIINKNQIENISGNARSLNLQLAHYEPLIPVSRSFPREKLL